MFKNFRTLKFSAIIIFITISGVACDQSNKTTDTSNNKIAPPITPPETLTTNIDEPAANNIANNLWLKSQQYLNDTYSQANDLHKAIENLLARPDESSLVIAQKQWQLTMIAYEKLSPFLYLESEKYEQINNSLGDSSSTISERDKRYIDSNNILDLEEWRHKIATWPIQPGFLDSYGPHIHSGLVNDITLTLDPHSLRTTNLMTDSEEVTLGLYAMEYLLFGDKEYENKSNTYFKRFLEITIIPEPLAQAGLVIDELPNNRRRALIELQSRLLVNDINMLLDLYDTDGELFKTFEQLSSFKKLQAFQRSVKNSLHKNQELFSYYDNDLTFISNSNDTNTQNIIDESKANTDNAKEENLNNINADKEDPFTKRFLNNRTLALKNNLTTIKSLFVSDIKNPEDSDKETQISMSNMTLSDLLLADEEREIALEAIGAIEKEIERSDYLTRDIIRNIETITAVLSR